jgi:hypothetical protein
VLYGQLFYSTSVLMAGFWILIVPTLILAYAGLYAHKLGGAARPRVSGVILHGVLLLMLFVGFLLANNLTLVEAPTRWLGKYAASPAGGSLHLEEPSLWGRLALVVLPGLASAGVGLSFRGAVLRHLGDPGAGRAAGLLGGRAALLGVLLGLGAGGLYLGLAPAESRAFLLGGGAPTGLVSSAAVAASLAAALAVIDAARPSLARALGSAVALAGAVACLVVVRDLHRAHAVRAYFRVDSVPVHLQPGMLALFAVSLVVGLVVVVVLLRLTVRGLLARARAEIAARQ